MRVVLEQNRIAPLAAKAIDCEAITAFADEGIK